jgi:hypothetical protein
MNLKLKRSRSTDEHEAKNSFFKIGWPLCYPIFVSFRDLRGEKRRSFMSSLTLRLVSMVAGYVCTIALAGCGSTTVTPTFPAATGLPKPDRVLVFDFAATPAEAGIDSGTGSLPQTEEDVQVGKALAQALSVNLVRDLRDQGIDAYRANEAAAPGETTASIKGSLLRDDSGTSTTSTPVGFSLGSSQVRTQVQVLQGTGIKLQLVGEAETATPSSLIPGTGTKAGVDADAASTAQAVAERVITYYRQQGWIKQ